ncbi:hypothetical protein HCR_07310 [Hydrogenimonas cancrithermarum]|uniref:Diguanylate cyclase/phosphodiesterase n=2 Tax=Hydrogenimonas cancrithermarum TaxID=2993563 RepID=A0ABM8FL40_9BACT|nr:hypothetical protein HCR_07310 [Hydrogenimonas cancrithermarum]
MELNRHVERYNEQILEPLFKLGLLLSELHHDAMRTLIPITKEALKVERRLPYNHEEISKQFTSLLSNDIAFLDRKTYEAQILSLKNEWKVFEKKHEKLLKSLKKRDKRLEHLYSDYLFTYTNFQANLDALKKYLDSHFNDFIENEKKSITNTFYLAAVLAVSTLVLLFFLLQEVNTINRKLKKYLEEREDFQKRLAEANRALTDYSEKLEDEVKRRTEEALDHLMKNPLTKFPNRLSFIKKLGEFPTASIALFNIDHFRSYNDLFGAKVGDRIIQEYAAYLRQTIPYLYEIYHLQGDEFAIVEPNKKTSGTFQAMMKQVAQLVREFHYTDSNGNFVLQVSMGVAIDEEQALNKADMALRQAKSSNESLVFYSEALIGTHHYLENITMTKVLSSAIKQKRIVPYFQAIAETSSGKIVKYEVLARLIDEEGNVIPPGQFMQLAKQIKLYEKITKSIFEKAMDAIEKYGLHLNVNLSADDIHHLPIRDYIIDRLAMSQYSDHLTLELLESEETKNYEDVRAFIQRVKQYGVKIAIDDFGSGYSNFAKILKLRIDYLKIDGSFISKIDTDPDSKEFVEIIQKLAKTYDIETVAEYVSSESIYREVRAIGIDFAQGYHISKPKPLEEILIDNTRHTPLSVGFKRDTG